MPCHILEGELRSLRNQLAELQKQAGAVSQQVKVIYMDGSYTKEESDRLNAELEASDGEVYADYMQVVRVWVIG